MVASMLRSRRNGLRNLKFGRYPYTVTRIKVMKSLLLTKDDYLRMKNMGLNEMIRFLEEGQYKKEIDAFAQGYRGTELMELALHGNLANVVNKIFRISLHRETRMLLSFYANKWVFGNIKTVFRAKLNKISQADVRYAIIPIVPTTDELCVRLVQESEETVFRFLQNTFDMNVHGLREHYRAGNLAGIENELDRAYYTTLAMVFTRLKLSRTDPLRQFIQTSVDLVNIRNVIRLKMAGIEAGAIRPHLIMAAPSRKTKGKDLLTALIHASDAADVFEVLRSSEYGSIIPDGLPDMAALENRMDAFLYQFAFRMLHRQPLSIAPIFGFLLMKEIEVRNIRLLLHAKALGMGPEVVEENLILPRR